MPIKRLCELAREREIITLVDGAQTFAQMPVFRDLGYDSFVTKSQWLSAPIGTGMLIVKESQIDRTSPPHAPFDPPPHNVQAAARA